MVTPMCQIRSCNRYCTHFRMTVAVTMFWHMKLPSGADVFNKSVILPCTHTPIVLTPPHPVSKQNFAVLVPLLFISDIT
jgi:hypothetical protein